MRELWPRARQTKQMSKLCTRYDHYLLRLRAVALRLRVKHEEKLLNYLLDIVYTALNLHRRESPAVKKAYTRRGSSPVSLQNVLSAETESVNLNMAISLCFFSPRLNLISL
jgi:hypothetical protein